MQNISMEELVEHIAVLKKEHHVSVTIFMGAGVSISAGVPSANDIMRDLEQKFPHAISKAKAKSYGEYMRCLGSGTRKELIKKYIANPKVNIAHLYLGSLVKCGYVDRILTTNFDPIAIKALGLNNIYPSIYDMAETKRFKSNEIMDPSIFYIHGRYNGYHILNTDEELRIHSDAVRQLFEDTSRKRCWIVIGYSGENDPLFEKFSEMEEYTYGLYWIGYGTLGNRAKEFLDTRDDVFYLGSYDADSFFIKLANGLGLSKPPILADPFSFLKEAISLITPISKDGTNLSITQKALKDIDAAILTLQEDSFYGQIDLIQKTREIWALEKYDEIEGIYDQVLHSDSDEAKSNLATAIHNRLKDLDGVTLEFQAYDSQYHAILNSMNKPYSKEEIDKKASGVVKEFISLDGMTEYQSDEELTALGFSEAKKLFGCEDITFCGKRLYGNDLVKPYVYRIYLRTCDFKLIEKEFNANNRLNYVNEVSKKLGIPINFMKAHYIYPAKVGADATLLHTGKDSSVIVHVQVTYGIKDGERYPLELLVGKYMAPLQMIGFMSDYKAHSEYTYSKLVDNVLPAAARSELIQLNNGYYYPFFSFVKHIERLYTYGTPPLLRVMIVTDAQCNYRCKFCCFLDEETDKDPDHIDMSDIDIDDFQLLLDCAAEAGYKRIMFTGGEPLLLEEQTLLRMVKAVTSNKGFEDFWITTNGSLLNTDLLYKLKQAGLRRIVVSIPAATDQTYHSCNKSDVKLSDILKNVGDAIRIGIDVRVDVPLCVGGISNVNDLLSLIEQVKVVGVNKLCYFGLHESAANHTRFKSLYVEPDHITKELFFNDDWKFQRAEGGEAFFVHNNFRISLPGVVRKEGIACRRNHCEYYCQGSYASYLIKGKKGYIVRGCHRDFGDGRNEFFISTQYLHNKEINKITDCFLRAKKYGSGEP